MVWHPCGVHFLVRMHTGGLRVAATSGYSLTTLRVARIAGPPGSPTLPTLPAAAAPPANPQGCQTVAGG